MIKYQFTHSSVEHNFQHDVQLQIGDSILLADVGQVLYVTGGLQITRTDSEVILTVDTVAPDTSVTLGAVNTTLGTINTSIGATNTELRKHVPAKEDVTVHTITDTDLSSATIDLGTYISGLTAGKKLYSVQLTTGHHFDGGAAVLEYNYLVLSES